MPQQLNVSRNKAGVEDLLLGVGVINQIRGGLEVAITMLNAKDLPFDATQNLETRLANIDAAAALVLAYGDVLTAIVDNLSALLAIPQVEIIGDTGDAATLEGQTLVQVRSGIDATRLQNQTVEQIRANVDAVTLQGSNLAAVRANINAATLEGQTLAQVRSGIDATHLEGKSLAEVREGGNAATLEGKTVAEITSQVTFPDATTTDKGRVRIVTKAEAKAGITTDAVPTLGDIWDSPAALIGWGTLTITKASGAAAAITLSQSFGVSGVSVTPEGTITITASKTFNGFCQMTPMSSSTFSGGTISSRLTNGLLAANSVNLAYSYTTYLSAALNANNASTANIVINFAMFGTVA